MPKKASPSKSSVSVLNERLADQKEAGKRVRILNEALNGNITEIPEISENSENLRSYAPTSGSSGAVYYTLNQGPSGRRVLRSDSGRYSERTQIHKVHSPRIPKVEPVVTSNTVGFEKYRL